MAKITTDLGTFEDLGNELGWADETKLADAIWLQHPNPEDATEVEYDANHTVNMSETQADLVEGMLRQMNANYTRS